MLNDKKFSVEKLSDDELEAVSGGAGQAQLMQIQCECGAVNLVDISRSSYMCKNCKKVKRIDG